MCLIRNPQSNLEEHEVSQSADKRLRTRCFVVEDTCDDQPVGKQRPQFARGDLLLLRRWQASCSSEPREHASRHLQELQGTRTYVAHGAYVDYYRRACAVPVACM